MTGCALCPTPSQWLEIQPEDDEKTRSKKKKLAKSYKSKMRFQKMDTETKSRQSSWLDFQKGKGTKKKAGFFTGACPAEWRRGLVAEPSGPPVGPPESQAQDTFSLDATAPSSTPIGRVVVCAGLHPVLLAPPLPNGAAMPESGLDSGRLF